MENVIPKKPPKWCIKKIDENFVIDSKTGVITWSRDYRQMKKGTVVGSPNTTGYIRVRLYNSKHGLKYLLAQHVAWYMYYGKWPDHKIDHWDGDEGNNSKKNLRKATHSQNRRNSKVSSNNKCGERGIRIQIYKGKNGDIVYYHPRIYVEGKRIYLGCFKDIRLAIEAREKAEKKYYNEFGYVNRPK